MVQKNMFTTRRKAFLQKKIEEKKEIFQRKFAYMVEKH